MLKFESLLTDSFFAIIWSNWSLKLETGAERKSRDSVFELWTHYWWQKGFLKGFLLQKLHFPHKESWFHLIKHQFTMKVQNPLFQLFFFSDFSLDWKKKQKQSCNEKEQNTCFSFWKWELGSQVTQIEKKLHSVKYLSSLEEWVRFVLVGKVVRNSVPVGSTIKWSPRNIYHRIVHC